MFLQIAILNYSLLSFCIKSILLLYWLSQQGLFLHTYVTQKDTRINGTHINF